MKTLGVIAPFLMGTYPGALVAALYARVREAGANLLLLRTGSQDARYQLELSLERADAWVVILNAASPDLLRKIHASGHPVCVIGHDYGLPELGLVRTDNAAGIRSAMQHLYAQGRRSFAYIGPSNMDDCLERQAAFEGFIREHTDCTPPLLAEAPDFSYAGGQDAMEVLIKQGASFCALIAATDNIASGAIAALQDQGIKVPDDVAVIGFDNSIFSRISGQGISSLDQNLTQLANTAFDDVARRLHEPGIAPIKTRIAPSLVARKSSGDTEQCRSHQMIDRDVAQSFIAVSEEVGQLSHGGRANYLKDYLKRLEFRLRFASVIRLSSNGQSLQVLSELPRSKHHNPQTADSSLDVRRFPENTDAHIQPQAGDFLVILMQEGLAQGPEIMALCFRNTDLSNPLTIETLAHEIELLCYQLHVQMMSDELSRTLETLRATQDELLRSEKNAALGNVIAGIAHELNTPLGNSLLSVNTLEDYSEIAQRKFVEGALKRTDVEELFGTLNMAVQLINRNLGVAFRLLGDFKQINSEQSAGAPILISLPIFMQDLANMLRVRGEQASTNIVLRDCSDLEFETYPQLLAQVLNELVKNALTHGLANTPHAEIGISALADAKGVELTIEDNGCGLPANALQRVFDPFFTTRMGTASGLGLTMVHNLVTGPLNGKVRVESFQEKGTKFVINLPLTPEKLSSM